MPEDTPQIELKPSNIPKVNAEAKKGRFEWARQVVAKAFKPMDSDVTPAVSDNPPKDRFQPNDTYFMLENKKTKLRHFEPIGDTGRDRFNNRVFVSPLKYYHDREHKPTKAAMLVSPEGEEFVRANPGILSDIDTALMNLKRDGQDSVEVNSKHKLKKYAKGGQSEVYLFETGGKKYILKTSIRESRGVGQPYINEMLQTQAISKDLLTVLNQYGLEMPTFLFATGSLSCQEFVDGNVATRKDVEPFIHNVGHIVRKYAEQQRSKDEYGKDSLWKNVSLDIWSDGALSVRYDNFIKRYNGKFVWVDPLCYRK